LKNLVLMIRLIGVHAAAGRYDEAAVEYQNYRKLTFAAVPIILKKAQPWSLFNPEVHKAHFDDEMGWPASLSHCVSLDLARLCRPNRLVWVRCSGTI
jgi:hypothetical protein